MTRYRDDRDRYDDRDLTSDDRRMRDDRRPGWDDRDGRRGMPDRGPETFQRGDDRSGERYLYADRSGMGGRERNRQDFGDRSGMSREMDRERDMDSGQRYRQGGQDRSGFSSGGGRLSGPVGGGPYGGASYGDSRYVESRDRAAGSPGTLVYGAGTGSMSGSSGYGQEQGYGQAQGGYGPSGMGMGGHRGRGPRGYQRSDDRIREMVNDALEDDDHVDASDIEVQVQGGEVTLTGTVGDRQQKRRAEEAIEHLRGVRDVHNQLRVQRSELGQGGRDHSGLGPSGMNPPGASTQSGLGQAGSSQSSLGSQGGGIGLGGSASSVDRTGSTGYSSSEDTLMGSLGSSAESTDRSGENR